MLQPREAGRGLKLERTDENGVVWQRCRAAQFGRRRRQRPCDLDGQPGRVKVHPNVGDESAVQQVPAKADGSHDVEV